MRLKRALKRFVVPATRWYVRKAPWKVGKVRVLERLGRPDWPFVVRTSGGFWLRGNTTDFVQSTVFFFGEWEPNITAWIRRTLRPGDVFVDVGANVGYYTLLAAQLVGPSGAVVAIEASPSIFALLEENVALNPDLANRIRCVNTAVLDRPGTVIVHHGPRHNIGLTSVVSPAADSWAEATVPAAPLDQLLTALEVERARIVKIDVEGAEWFVAQGMRQFLRERSRSLEVLLEITPHRVVQTGHEPADVLRVFTDAGLEIYWIDNDYRTESLLRGAVTKPVPFTGPIVTDTDLVLSPSISR